MGSTGQTQSKPARSLRPIAPDTGVADPATAMLIVERVVALSRVPAFLGMPDYLLAEVAQIVEEVVLEAGEIVIEEGRDESWMFVLVDGGAAIELAGRRVATFAPGDLIGELAAFDPSPRSATVITTESSLLFRIDHDPFHELLLEQPQLMSGIVTMLARRLRATTDLHRRHGP